MMYYQTTKRGVIITVVITLLLLIGSLLLIPRVKTNYDLTTYLPKDSNTKEGLIILDEYYQNEAQIQLMLSETTVSEVIQIKALLVNVEYVKSVIWIDDYVDIRTIPIEFIPADIRETFYKDNNALLEISFLYDSYDIRLEESIEEIKTLLSDHNYSFRGEVLSNIESRNVASHETFKIMFIILPFCILVLLFASKSFLEPFIILVTLGIGILLNQGTNAFLPNVSFITMTMALALQLAMSLDYALFMIHRFYEYQDQNYDVNTSVRRAFKSSLIVISTSALTTIAGFVALFFMDYKIGLDIGLVLSKGILLSYLSVIFVLPVLLYLFSPLLNKTRHKVLLPSFKHVGSFVIRFRYYLLLIFVIVFGLSLYYSRDIKYIYGNQSSRNNVTELEMHDEKITDVFGPYNPVVIIVKNQTVQDEVNLVTQLSQMDEVEKIIALVQVIDPSIDRTTVDQRIISNFISGEYNRFIIYTSIKYENDDLFEFTKNLDELVTSIYGDAYYVGLSTSIKDIKQSVLSDSLLIVILSALSVLLVVVILFKSLFVPIMLVLVIEFAIYFNLFILFITDTSMLYIGYLVVMSIQLGATIDYAVLLADRYHNEIKKLPKKDALLKTYQTSIPTIFVSMIILFIAGLIEGIFSEIDAIKSIGYFLAKGTLISFVSVILFTGPFLLLMNQKNKQNG